MCSTPWFVPHSYVHYPEMGEIISKVRRTKHREKGLFGKKTGKSKKKKAEEQNLQEKRVYNIHVFPTYHLLFLGCYSVGVLMLEINNK
jgi:allophanate hydrolase subunit 1